MTEMHPEELFPPRPGGMVDTVRRQQAAEAAQAAQLAGAPEPDTGYPAILVRDEQPELGTARAVTLSASYPVAQLLPQDPRRRSAVVIAIDNDVYLTTSQGLAQDVAGVATSLGAAYLPKGVPIPIVNKATHWVACTTTAVTSRVSVFVNRDHG